MSQDDYFDRICDNPFRLAEDANMFKARAEELRERTEQTALLKKVPIHLRKDDHASRNRNLGLVNSTVSTARPSRVGTTRIPSSTSRSQDSAILPQLPRQNTRREHEERARLDMYSPLYTGKYAHLPKKDQDFLEKLVRDTGPRPKLDEYMAKQREIFLVELALQTKKNEISNINEVVQEKERGLRKETRRLDAEVTKFDKFVRHSDLGTVKTIAESERAVKARAQRQEMIRNTSSQIVAIRSEIAKGELAIIQLHKYRLFLDQLMCVSDREILIHEREMCTLRRMAVAFCIEKYGHCHGLCLDCFCIRIPPTLVASKAIEPYHLLVEEGDNPKAVCHYDKILTDDTVVFTNDLGDTMDFSKGVEETDEVLKSKPLHELIYFFTIPPGRCTDTCANCCDYLAVRNPDDKQYLQRVVPSIFEHKSSNATETSDSPSRTTNSSVSPTLAGNLKQLGLTLRQLIPATNLKMEDYAHFPCSEPGLTDFCATNIGLFVRENISIPFVDTTDFLESLRSIESTNFFLLEYLHNIETSREASAARALQEYRNREAEIQQLMAQQHNLRAIVSGVSSGETSTEAAHVEGMLDYNVRLNELLETAIREVYVNCTHTSPADAASIASLSMLSKIERLLERSSVLVKKLPLKYHVVFEKACERARRKERHQRKQEELAILHAEKIARARERALEPIKYNISRKVMARSYINPHRVPAHNAATDEDEKRHLQFITAKQGNADFGPDFYV